MLRLLLFVLLAVPAAALFTACSRSNTTSEATFYGTWTKGNLAGDTIIFSNRGGKNIMRYNASFNSSLPKYTETDYSVRNERLYIGDLPFSPLGGTMYTEIQGFTWLNTGWEFRMRANQMWPFLAMAEAYFTFKRVR
jgi:hypothetical protein